MTPKRPTRRAAMRGFVQLPYMQEGQERQLLAFRKTSRAYCEQVGEMCFIEVTRM